MKLISVVFLAALIGSDAFVPQSMRGVTPAAKSSALLMADAPVGAGVAAPAIPGPAIPPPPPLAPPPAPEAPPAAETAVAAAAAPEAPPAPPAAAGVSAPDTPSSGFYDYYRNADMTFRSYPYPDAQDWRYRPWSPPLLRGGNENRYGVPPMSVTVAVTNDWRYRAWSAPLSTGGNMAPRYPSYDSSPQTGVTRPITVNPTVLTQDWRYRAWSAPLSTGGNLRPRYPTYEPNPSL